MADSTPFSKGQMQVRSRKVPAPEPIVFVNAAEFSASGMEVYMDLGVIPVDAIAAALQAAKDNPGEPPIMDFHVSHRFGMSFHAAALIHQRLTLLLQHSAAQLKDAMPEQVPGTPPEEQK
jgi:hypothetical protein